ncbi:MAG: DNA mismatch repair protein MutS [Nanoarchaeota archaeon]|nr:DNA mismatch repair protein MutS [Nanoarchaeota archaeon]
MELTPAMMQYMEIKKKHKDCIVFFRMGDFYETFYDDAKVTSKALDIALTRRGIKNTEREIPLAGIPYHSLDTYLAKMIKQGFKVVLVDQIEDPKLAKGLVKRDVVRIVTPGTYMETTSKANNFACAIFPAKEKVGVALADLSTGEFYTFERDDLASALQDIQKFPVSEVMLPMSYEKASITSELKEYRLYLTYISDIEFYHQNAQEALTSHFKVHSLDGFGLKAKEAAVSAAGALLSYLHETQKSRLGQISHISYYSDKDHLAMDQVTIRNLEIDGTEKSLFSLLDRTGTAMGSRLLKRTLISPLTDSARILGRHAAIEELCGKQFLLEELRELLRKVGDIDRLTARICFGNASPRDLANLQASLSLIPDIKKILTDMDSELLTKLAEIEENHDVAEEIDKAICDEPPISMNEGGFIRDGYNPELDRYRLIAHDAKKLLLKIEEEEKQKTGIKSLKIRYNQVFGYYIDVTKPNLDMVPAHFVKKQTLVNSERFITDELKKLEDEILNAQDRMIDIEKALFSALIEKIRAVSKKIQLSSDKLAMLDMLCAFSIVSLKSSYVKPTIDDSKKLILKKSRHPIVEVMSDFVSNDVSIDEENRVMIITGPNMAGKSVFMKQVALSVVLAQAGCFVPADSATIGIVDKIFSRTGATDDISTGQSTFMVEMTQTAQILNNATERSLIILDEIGRGTSTFDGVAIAWAVAEFIATKIKAKTMFATHYHVLNNLEKQVKGVKNYNIAVQEKEDKIIFLRKIIDGGTDKSYGIHVAKLAGMPTEVVDISRRIQFKLEQEDDISEKIVVETRKRKEKDKIRRDIEEVDRLIKSRQKTLDEL